MLHRPAKPLRPADRKLAPAVVHNPFSTPHAEIIHDRKNAVGRPLTIKHAVNSSARIHRSAVFHFAEPMSAHTIPHIPSTVAFRESRRLADTQASAVR